MCDRGAHRLRVLSFSGEALRDIGSEGRRPGEFKEPTSCIVAHGRLFTAEAAGARLQVLTMAGEPLQVPPLPTANRLKSPSHLPYISPTSPHASPLYLARCSRCSRPIASYLPYLSPYVSPCISAISISGEVLPMPTANRVPPCLHGLCLGDRERQLWATDTDRNVLHRLSNPNTNLSPQPQLPEGAPPPQPRPQPHP